MFSQDFVFYDCLDFKRLPFFRSPWYKQKSIVIKRVKHQAAQRIDGLTKERERDQFIKMGNKLIV